MYICIYIYIYIICIICIHKNICVVTCVCACVRVCVRMCVCLRAHAQLHSAAAATCGSNTHFRSHPPLRLRVPMRVCLRVCCHTCDSVPEGMSLCVSRGAQICIRGRVRKQPCRAGPHGVELGRTVRPPCMRERRLQGRLRLPGHECGVAGLILRGLLPACRAPSARAGCGWDGVPGSWQRPGRRPRPTGAVLLHAQLTLCCQENTRAERPLRRITGHDRARTTPARRRRWWALWRPPRWRACREHAAPRSKVRTRRFRFVAQQYRDGQLLLCLPQAPTSRSSCRCSHQRQHLLALCERPRCSSLVRDLRGAAAGRPPAKGTQRAPRGHQGR